MRRGLETEERRALVIYPAIKYAKTMLFNSIIKKNITETPLIHVYQ
jgi:hypothetical protein